MFVIHYKEVPEQLVTDEGARGATIRWVIAQPTGATNFAMRIIEIEPGGQTPFHSHPFEHEVFVLSGVGELVGAEDRFPLTEGSVVFVPSGEEHNFRNTGSERLRFICCIPL